MQSNHQTAGAHTRASARRAARDDLAAALASLAIADISHECRACGRQSVLELREQIHAGSFSLAALMQHRLRPRELRRLALAIGQALLR